MEAKGRKGGVIVKWEEIFAWGWKGKAKVVRAGSVLEDVCLRVLLRHPRSQNCQGSRMRCGPLLG